MEHQLAMKSTRKKQAKNLSSSSSPQQASPNQATAHPLLRLQRAIGNQAVQNIMRSEVGVPNQPYEPRTHALASPAHLVLQRKCACGGTPGLDGECAECRAKRLAMQRCSSSGADFANNVSPIVHSVLKSPGQPLPSAIRNFMEPRFGQDLSHVRVHTDTEAAESAQAVNALAYTVGNNIFFGSGSYTPETSAGKKLLAHELTHVMQQASGRSSMIAGIDHGPADPLERAADQRAAAVVSMNPTALTTGISAPTNLVSPIHSSTPQIQRQQTPVQEGSQPPPDRTFWERLKSQKEMYRRMFMERRYGCWCGPGNVCEEERDKIDACCKRHDLAYDALGVSGSEPKPGQVDMWSIEGLRRTVEADLTLLGCLTKTIFDLNFYGPAAADYRALAQLIFEARVEMGIWIRLNILPEVGTILIASTLLGFGLYEIGKAGFEGKEQAIGYAFSNGYARMLANITSNTHEAVDPTLLSVDWERVVQEQGSRYQESGADNEQALALLRIERAGEAAILQDVDNYIKQKIRDMIEKVNDAAILQDVDAYIKDNVDNIMYVLQQNHQNKYGKGLDERKRNYLEILYRQVEEGKGPRRGSLAIPLTEVENVVPQPSAPGAPTSTASTALPPSVTGGPTVLSGSHTVPVDVHRFGKADSQGNPIEVNPPRESDIPPAPDDVGPEPKPGQQWPNGSSTFGDINVPRRGGHYWRLDKGTSLTEGINIMADGLDVGGPQGPTHHTIYPIVLMPFRTFVSKHQGLGWKYVGRKPAPK